MTELETINGGQKPRISIDTTNWRQNIPESTAEKGNLLMRILFNDSQLTYCNVFIRTIA
jgi:hypothetical protein